MKNLIKKVFFFSTPPIIALISIGFIVDGTTDAFYIRFTTPKQQSLILGTSRAAQALQPIVFKKVLKKDIYNYSFTGTQSPFGKIYYESIKQKHNKAKNGIFIIAIDPWSISSQCENPNDLSSFRENNLCLDNTYLVDIKPNYQYLYKNLEGKYKDIFIPPTNYMYLHTDGWLEIKDLAMDSLSILRRTDVKINTYRNEMLPKSKFSTTRLLYLKKTVSYLKEFGEVYLVRIPIHDRMMQIENDLMPNFNIKIKEVQAISNGYIDLTTRNGEFKYLDGTHLHQDSGKKVSIILANWIKNQQKKNKY